MDFIIHRAWAFLREGHKVFTPNGLWNFRDLLVLHIKVLEEMNRRGFIHRIKDELDEQTSPSSDLSESIAANGKNAEGDEELEKGWISKVDDFPNLVFNEEGAIEFFRKGKVNASNA